jgi:hypothetical protein
MRTAIRVGVLLASSLVLAACASAPRREAPPPDLQLLESAPLSLAEGCTAAGSYIVEFVVDAHGRTTNITPPLDGPACVREALAAWAASFRYAPPPAPTPACVEWLLVTASRGS